MQFLNCQDLLSLRSSLMSFFQCIFLRSQRYCSIGSFQNAYRTASNELISSQVSLIQFYNTDYHLQEKINHFSDPPLLHHFPLTPARQQSCAATAKKLGQIEKSINASVQLDFNSKPLNRLMKNLFGYVLQNNHIQNADTIYQLQFFLPKNLSLKFLQISTQTKYLCRAPISSNIQERVKYFLGSAGGMQVPTFLKFLINSKSNLQMFYLQSFQSFENKLQMKVSAITEASSACTTPTQQNLPPEERFLPFLSHMPTPQRKVMKLMTNTMYTEGLLSRTISSNRPTKANIRIMPFSREKIRVGQCELKKKQSSQLSTLDRLSKRSARRTCFEINRSIQGVRSKEYVQFFTMLAFAYNKSKQNSHKIDFLISQLIVFFGQKREKEYIKDIEEILKESSRVKAGLFANSEKLSYQIIKNVHGEMAKLFLNICYELYLYKQNEYNFLQLDIINRDIEYYARRLGMLNLTAATCMDMGKVCLQFFQFEKASENYSKALKLAVYTGDKYRQEICIDKLGLCEYYRGDMVSAHYYHSSVGKLSTYNKIKIKEHYSNEKQMQKILEQKTKRKSHEEEVNEEFFKLYNEKSEFNFDSAGIDYEYTQKNYDHFRTDLKEMIKINALRKKVPIIKNNLQRTLRIGQKKIKGNNYIIPKASKFHLYSKERSQDQLVLTHRSYNRSNIYYESSKIDKYCSILEEIINFFAADLKFRSKVITEQRESTVSEDIQ